MATLFWKHNLKVTIAGLIITDPKISISIKKEADHTPPTGYVNIFNLNVNTERQIYERGSQMTLEGGYGDDLGILFDGAVQKVERERLNLSRVTRIKLTGKVQEKAATETSRSTFFASYQDEIKVRTLVTDIVKAMGLTAGPLDAIPEDAVLPIFYWSADANTALDTAIRDLGLTWYQDGDFIRINKPGEQQSDSSTVSISPENGLIDSPSVTDDGARVRCLLSSNYNVGDVLELTSTTLSGQFKIITVTHRGDNWTGSFFSELELREM